MSSFDKSGSAVKASIAAGAIAVALAVALQSPTLLAQPAVQGQWRTLPYLMPINPVHLALTNDGKVLVVAGSGNVATETNFQAVVWDPVDNTFVTHALAWDMFCNGMSVLPDGRVFINGGNLQYDPFFGEPRSSAYDPATGTFSDLREHGRRPLVSHGDDAGQRQRHDVLGTEGHGRHEHDGRNLHAGGGMERAGRGGLDAAALPANASEHGRPRLLLGLRPRLAVLQSRDDDVDGGRRHDELRQHAHLRHVRPAPAHAGEPVSAARHDFRRQQPGNGDDRNHRSCPRRLLNGSSDRRCPRPGSR